jgi:hypothetical protein
LGLLDIWREARGTMMRKEFDDIVKRMDGANLAAITSFFNNVDATIGILRENYRPASPLERKALLRECKKSANAMWERGDWPSSLGLAISALNVESESTPGSDAAYVKAETDKVIQEAFNFLQRRN